MVFVTAQSGQICLRCDHHVSSPARAGHGDSRWLTAVTEQAKVLTHTSNLFHTVPQVLAARQQSTFS